MPSIELPPRVIARLTEFGWSDERSIDKSQWENVLTSCGFRELDEAKQTLRILAGLTVDGPLGCFEFSLDNLEFWTEQPGAIEKLGELAGEPISPIGGGIMYGCFVGASNQTYMIDVDQTCFWRFESLGGLLEFILFGDDLAITEFKQLSE